MLGFRAAVEGHRARGDRYMELMANFMLACALALAGRAEEALTVSRETALLCEEFGERHARSYANWAAGVAHWRLGHLDEAERSARQVLKVDRSLADVIGVALTTDLLSWVANDRKQFGRARALSAAARHVWRSV